MSFTIPHAVSGSISYYTLEKFFVNVEPFDGAK